MVEVVDEHMNLQTLVTIILVDLHEFAESSSSGDHF